MSYHDTFGNLMGPRVYGSFEEYKQIIDSLHSVTTIVGAGLDAGNATQYSSIDDAYLYSESSDTDDYFDNLMQAKQGNNDGIAQVFGHIVTNAPQEIANIDQIINEKIDNVKEINMEKINVEKINNNDVVENNLANMDHPKELVSPNISNQTAVEDQSPLSSALNASSHEWQTVGAADDFESFLEDAPSSRDAQIDDYLI